MVDSAGMRTRLSPFKSKGIGRKSASPSNLNSPTWHYQWQMKLPDLDATRVKLFEVDYNAESQVYAIITVGGRWKGHTRQPMWAGVLVDGISASETTRGSNFVDRFTKPDYKTGCPECEMTSGYYYEDNGPSEVKSFDVWQTFQQAVHVKLSRGRHKLGLGMMAYTEGCRMVESCALSATFNSMS